MNTQRFTTLSSFTLAAAFTLAMLMGVNALAQGGAASPAAPHMAQAKTTCPA